MQVGLQNLQESLMDRHPLQVTVNRQVIRHRPHHQIPILHHLRRRPLQSQRQREQKV